MSVAAQAVLNRCLQRGHRFCASQSRLFSTDTPDTSSVESGTAVPQVSVDSLGYRVDDVSSTAIDHPAQSRRWQFKRHDAPQRKQMYHRRHAEQKKVEKRQNRIEHLQQIHHEAYAKGNARLAEAAGGEAERLQQPWLQRNVPIKPPSYASAKQEKQQQVKVVQYDGSTLPKDKSLGLSTTTDSLDVLNFKVGYAIDAQYALPSEVQAFVLDQTTFCLYGVDKNQVTQIASNIRRIRPPEPYKGAGIRIVGESIKLKERKLK